MGLGDVYFLRRTYQTANVYVYIPIYMCIYLYTCVYIYIYIHVYIHTCIHIFVCTLYVCMCIYIYIYTYTDIHIIRRQSMMKHVSDGNAIMYRTAILSGRRRRMFQTAMQCGNGIVARLRQQMYQMKTQVET